MLVKIEDYVTMLCSHLTYLLVQQAHLVETQNLFVVLDRLHEY